MNGSDACRSMGMNGSPKLLAVRANKWSSNPKVKAYIHFGRQELRKKQILTREEALQITARIARKRGNDDTVLRAVERAAKMQGFDKPTEVEIKLEGSILHQIRSA